MSVIEVVFIIMIYRILETIILCILNKKLN